MTPSALDAEGFIARWRGESLAANDKLVHEQCLVSLLRERHDEPSALPAVPLPGGTRLPWPDTLPEQIRVVTEVVLAAPAPLDLEQLAAHFIGRGPWKKRLPDIVDSLAALGRVKSETRDGRTVLHE